MHKNGKYKYIVVGAGLAGLVLAERIANVLGEKVLVIEKENHIGGACYDEIDDYGVLVGKFGPHTFHTSDREIFSYITQFCQWNHYVHRALSFVEGRFVHFPICRKTVCELYGLVETDEQTAAMIEEHKDDIAEKFFVHFTKKQWGCDRSELDASVLSRIPFRSNDDDRYFTDLFQGNPIGGYTRMFQKMVESKNITILLNCDYKDVIDDYNYEKLFFTGPIDYYFDYSLGKLLYRSVKFNFEHHDIDSYQPVASTRYPGPETPFTRITEFKKMTGQKISGTTILKEIPCFEGEPYYPYPTKRWKELAQKYRELAKSEKKTVFVGRLGEYKYYDMDDVVRRSLDVFNQLKDGKI